MSLYAVVRSVRPLHQYAARAVASSLGDARVTVATRAVLERLHESGPQTVPQLGRSLWLPRQAVQRVVDGALGHGLLERRPNPAHRRSPIVALTAEGTATFERLHGSELENLRVLAAELDPADIEAAVRVMSALTRRMRDLAGAEAPSRTASQDDA